MSSNLCIQTIALGLVLCIADPLSAQETNETQNTNEAAGKREVSGVASIEVHETPTDLEAPNEETSKKSEKIKLSIGTDLILNYAYEFFENEGASDSFHHFRLDRAFVDINSRYNFIETRLLLEGVYATSGGGTLSIANDSVVIRFREAWVRGHAFDWLSFDIGLVRALTEPAIADAEEIRVLGQNPFIANGLYAPSNLGIRANLKLPSSLGKFYISASNGEGLGAREVGNNKQLETLVDLTPLSSFGDVASNFHLRLSFLYRKEGVASVERSRYLGAISYESKWLRAGVAGLYHRGLGASGDQKGMLFYGFARAELDSLWLISARASYWDPNNDRSSDQIQDMTLGLGFIFLDNTELLAFFRARLLGSQAELENTESDRYQIGISVRNRFASQW